MSNDVAVLGLSIDSRPAVAATKALNDLTAAAKPAAAAAASVEKATANAGKGAAALAAGTGLARHEMINLNRQLTDVGVSLASGQSPFMVLVQQGAQVADIFGSSKTGTVGGALKQIVNYVGPIRLVAGGIAGIAAAGYLASSALSGSLKALDDVAKTANTSIGALHGLQTAAGFKGIGSDDFQKAMGRFADDVYRAKTGAGELAEFLRAYGQSAKSFEDAISKVAELIKNASSDQQRLQLLQQAGLPATMDWVRLLSQGGDAIKLAIKSGDDFDNGPAARMIARAREFDDAWNKHTTNAANAMKSWLLGLDDTTSSLIDKFKQLAQNSYGNGAPPKRINITGGTTMPKSAPTIDKNELLTSIARQQPALGLFGQTPTAKQAHQPKPKDNERDSDRTRLPAAA
jgi:hypothetical protein